MNERTMVHELYLKIDLGCNASIILYFSYVV